MLHMLHTSHTHAKHINKHNSYTEHNTHTHTYIHTVHPIYKVLNDAALLLHAQHTHWACAATKELWCMTARCISTQVHV